MSELFAALQRLFSGFGVPCWREGSVPRGASPPCLTWAVQATAPDAASLTVRLTGIPGRSGAGLLLLLDRLRAEVPAGGRVLPAGQARWWLIPEAVRFGQDGLPEAVLSYRLARVA